MSDTKASDADATLRRGDIDDLDDLKALLDEGYNLSPKDCYALVSEIIVLRAKLGEARSTRNALISRLGHAAYPPASPTRGVDQ